VPKAA
jgi:superoxide dismutase